ncbi:hypothetical protein [Nocardia sp. NPDC051832]|uniref:hypothetical protein n=1 Tax=Nocardia sp. NPDC051832 TaxID=3155673 RepID=UPI00343CC651
MPGVQGIQVSVADDFFAGDSYFRLSVRVPEAAESEVRDVVTRIDERMGRFAGLRERYFDVTVGARAGVSATKDLEVDSFLDVVRKVRRHTASVPDGRIHWEIRPTPRISIGDSNGTAEPLAAVRAMIGATTAAEVTLAVSDQESWNIGLPLSAEREEQLRRQLSEIPLAATFVVIEHDHIVELTVQNKEVSVFDTDLAYSQLADTVRKLRPITDHPLRLTWKWRFYYTDGKRNEGVVHVGGCDYSPPTVFDDALSAGALTVQNKMRADFGGCR